MNNPTSFFQNKPTATFFPQQQQQQQQQPTQGPTFGTTPSLFAPKLGTTGTATTTPTMAFGQQQQQQPAQQSNFFSKPQTSFSFGTTANTSTSTTSTPPIFGGFTSKPSFGLGSTFGSTLQNSSSLSFTKPSPTFSFAPTSTTSTPSLFSTPFQQQQQPPQQPQPQQFSNALTTERDHVIQRFESLKKAYMSTLPQNNNQRNSFSKFKHIFYNTIEPSQRHLYTWESTGGIIDRRQWEEAIARNPDPDDCVPIAIIGVEELHNRLSSQQGHMNYLDTCVEKLTTQTQALEQSSRKSSAIMESCRTTHLRLSHKLLKLMRKVELLRCMNLPLSYEEKQLRHRLDRLHQVVQQPIERVNHITSANKQEERHVEASYKLSANDQAEMYHILEYHREALEKLTSIVQKDMRDIEIMKRELTKELRKL